MSIGNPPTAQSPPGRNPIEWEERLNAALCSGDPTTLEKTLLALRDEMSQEAESLRTLDTGPLLSRLTEQARRLFQIAPTNFEALKSELEEERSIWAQYRQRYRNHFVPAALHPYLKSCGLFLRPSSTAPQFPKFNKYFGRTKHEKAADVLEAITLFSPLAESSATEGAKTIPPNFFSEFACRTGYFVIKRAYRTGLPRGAGTTCILEHIRSLVPNPGVLKGLLFDNVKNRQTYDVYVVQKDEQLILKPHPDENRAPLVKVAGRILRELNLKPMSIEPRLDGLGFLDLLILVA